MEQYYGDYGDYENYEDYGGEEPPGRNWKRIFLVILAIVVLSVGIGAGAYLVFGRSETGKESTKDTESGMNSDTAEGDESKSGNQGSPEFSAKRAMEHVKYLSERIGVRTFGSASEAQAADYIAGKLCEYGYTVEEQEFSNDEGFASENIIGTHRGTEEGFTIIVAAHFDSGAGSKGAVDNGSGVGAVLELARIFFRKQTKPTVKFVFFGSNKPGIGDVWDRLVGARRFLQSLGTFEIDEIIGLISVDSVGQGDVLALRTQETGLQRLRAKLETYANKNEVPVVLMKSANDSDNIPYEDSQIPAVWVGWCSPDGSLVTDNLITSVSSDKIQTTAELIESFILDLTNEDLEELKY